MDGVSQQHSVLTLRVRKRPAGDSQTTTQHAGLGDVSILANSPVPPSTPEQQFQSDKSSFIPPKVSSTELPANSLYSGEDSFHLPPSIGTFEPQEQSPGAAEEPRFIPKHRTRPRPQQVTQQTVRADWGKMWELGLMRRSE